MKLRYSLAFLATLACGGENGSGADERAPGAPVAGADLVSATGTFEASSGELEIAVSPRDAEGNFVGADLPESAFAFEDVSIGAADAAARTSIETRVTAVSVLEADSRGLTGVMVFDSSGSMSTNDPDGSGRRAAGAAIFDAMGAGDELAIMDFGAGTTGDLSASRLLQDFTSDRELLEASLEALTADGDTHMYASLLDALRLLADEGQESGMIVVLTDGQASDGELFQAVIDQAKEQKVQVHAVGLGTSLSFAELTRLGRYTGGGATTAVDAAQLGERFAGIGLGVSSGRVVVRGEGRYENLPAASVYEVRGTLVTHGDDGSTRTPFGFLTALSD